MSDQPTTTDEDTPTTTRATVVEDGAEAPQGKRIQKTSYEANAQVQRWLRDEAVEDGGRHGAFNPTFLANQRDRLWVLSSLGHFYEEGLITDVSHVVKSGKEATVYCCVAAATLGTDLLAAKVYRPRMFRSLKNDAIYREGRALHDEAGHRVRDRRHQRGAMNKTERWRATQVTTWIRDEFETQRLLYDAGADVPRPLAQIGNAVLMEYVGNATGAAPLLREVRLAPGEALPLWKTVLRNIELCLRHDRVHGDLSAYNVLYWQGTVKLIDFAQAVDPRYSADVFALLARDIERMSQYFARYGVRADAVMLAREMWARYLDGSL